MNTHMNNNVLKNRKTTSNSILPNNNAKEDKANHTERNFGKDLKNVINNQTKRASNMLFRKVEKEKVVDNKKKPKPAPDVICLNVKNYRNSTLTSNQSKNSVICNNHNYSKDSSTIIENKQETEEENKDVISRSITPFKAQETDMDVIYKDNLCYVSEYAPDIFHHVICTEVNIIYIII